MSKYIEEPVYLIASGYEWICPLCDYVHTEIEVVNKVYCKECDAYFNVYSHHHV